MQYNGGKAKVAKELAAVISEYSRGGSYWEPFVGAANVIQYVEADNKTGTDLCPHIIAFHQAVQNGWLPPGELSEEKYKELRERRNGRGNAMVAFAGYGCSLGGKFFGGYARGACSRNYASNARNSTIRKHQNLSDVYFSQCPYDQWLRRADVIYCDPPYRGTTRCGSTAWFDSDCFWEWARSRAKDSVVLVSEFSAPDFCFEIWSKEKRADMRRNDGAKMTERLFLVMP